jgi:parvulin-like peptidyl-prolyl isomerase
MKGTARRIPRTAAFLTAALAVALLATPALAKKKKKEEAKPAAAPAAAGDTSQVLVRIADQTITRADVQKRLDEMPEQVRSNFATPEGRQQLLDRMVEERVWLLTAEKKGVADRDKVQQQLAQQRRDLIIRTYLTEVMAGNPAPSDSEAKAYYDEHLSEYKMPATATVRHIQLKTKATAQKVLSLARAKGADFAKLAKQYSTDSLTKTSGGNLGQVSRDGQFAVIGRDPALADSVFATKPGKIGGPWKSAKGWHVMKVDEIKPESVRPFDQMRGMIVRQLSSQRSQDYYRQQLESARKALGVSADSDAIKKFVSQKKEAKELFKEAQEKGPAAERIAAYEKLLAVYPESEVSPQAQFMIGFIYSEELKNYDEAEKAFRKVLKNYPQSELAASAKWMVEHMRTEEAPAFMPMEADSSKDADHESRAGKSSTGKP